MFKMKKEIVNEVGLHSQSLTDLEGCSEKDAVLHI